LVDEKNEGSIGQKGWFSLQKIHNNRIRKVTEKMTQEMCEILAVTRTAAV
jgi:hypothetical protein